MLTKPIPRSASSRKSSGVFQLSWRTSSTSGKSAKARARSSSHSRFSSVRRNDQGNWRRRAPSLPASSMGSKAARASATSASVHASLRWCVKRCQSFAVKRKSGLKRTRRSHDSATSRRAGR